MNKKNFLYFIYFFFIFFNIESKKIKKNNFIFSTIIYFISFYGIYKVLNKILVDEKEKDHKIKNIIKKIRELTEHIKNYEKGEDKDSLKLKINLEIDKLLNNMNFIFLDSLEFSIDYKLFLIKLKSLILSSLLAFIPPLMINNN